MISKGKNMISIKRYDGLERATSQYLRNERIEYSSMKEMNGEENDNFSQNWIWQSILTKKGWTELLEIQQRKE